MSSPLAVMDTKKQCSKTCPRLKKCMEGYTQNANKRFNGTVWRMCPKHNNHGFTTMATTLAIADALLNDGATSLLEIMEEKKLLPGIFS